MTRLIIEIYLTLGHKENINALFVGYYREDYCLFRR